METEKKDFWSDKKNVAIVVLSVLLLIMAGLFVRRHIYALSSKNKPVKQSQTDKKKNKDKTGVVQPAADNSAVPAIPTNSTSTEQPVN